MFCRGCEIILNYYYTPEIILSAGSPHPIPAGLNIRLKEGLCMSRSPIGTLSTVRGYSMATQIQHSGAYALISRNLGTSRPLPWIQVQSLETLIERLENNPSLLALVRSHPDTFQVAKFDPTNSTLYPKATFPANTLIPLIRR